MSLGLLQHYLCFVTLFFMSHDFLKKRVEGRKPVVMKCDHKEIGFSLGKRLIGQSKLPH